MSVSVSSITPVAGPCHYCTKSCGVALMIEGLDVSSRTCIECAVKLGKALGTMIMFTDKAAHKELRSFYGVSKGKPARARKR